MTPREAECIRLFGVRNEEEAQQRMLGPFQAQIAELDAKRADIEERLYVSGRWVCGGMLGPPIEFYMESDNLLNAYKQEDPDHWLALDAAHLEYQAVWDWEVEQDSKERKV